MVVDKWTIPGMQEARISEELADIEKEINSIIGRDYRGSKIIAKLCGRYSDIALNLVKIKYYEAGEWEISFFLAGGYKQYVRID